MDYSPIVNADLNPLWWLVPIMVVIGVLKSAWFKGVTGEALVRFAAQLRLPSETYHSIHNVTLQTPDGTTQIDHILVSRFGVFVVETKHMKGWIFGAENDAQWTQKLFRSSFRFQNPLRQNYKHVKALEMALEIPGHVIHSVIVFSGASTFKTLLPTNVVRGGGYIRFIKSFQQQVLSDAQVEEILAQIQASRLPQSFATRRQHINNLRSRRDPSAERNCPRCGSRMVLRTAKHGRNAGSQFWGCSSFPRCKAVQSVA
jgi:restriction system protein